MPYTVRHRIRARIELEKCREDYAQYASDLDSWVARLADAVERKDVAISWDICALLDTVTSADPGAWADAARTWIRASTRAKMRALVAALRKRCPPWEFRMSIAAVPFLGFPWEVHIYYEVDHTEGQVVITKYDGLPGEDQRDP